MVCEGFSLLGKTTLAVLGRNQTALDYQQRLSPHFFYLISNVHDGQYVFQQENASIHKHGRPYKTVDTLKDAVQATWDDIAPELLLKLARLMTKRCIAFVRSKGAKIADYVRYKLLIDNTSHSHALQRACCPINCLICFCPYTFVAPSILRIHLFSNSCRPELRSS